MKYEGGFIVSVEYACNEKIYHVLAHGYNSGTGEKPFRFVEYVFFYLTESKRKNGTPFPFECCDDTDIKQYCEDCTEKECEYLFEHYDNGKCPQTIGVDEIKDAPSGIYIVV